MTAKKTSGKQIRKLARRKLIKGLTSPLQGGYKMSKIRKSK